MVVGMRLGGGEMVIDTAADGLGTIHPPGNPDANDVAMRSAYMIFDIATQVSYISHYVTLVPGDVIFTGTPAGVGAVHGRYLSDGDVIETTIEGVGTMTNTCVRIGDHHSPGDH